MWTFFRRISSSFPSMSRKALFAKLSQARADLLSVTCLLWDNMLAHAVTGKYFTVGLRLIYFPIIPHITCGPVTPSTIEPMTMLTVRFVHFPLSRAHWYLAVICFPGLEGPCIEPNPQYQPQMQSQAQASSPSELGSSVLSEGGMEEPSPHTEPISFNPEEVNTEADGEDVSHLGMPSCPLRAPEHSCAHSQRVNGQVQSHYTGECLLTEGSVASDEPGGFRMRRMMVVVKIASVAVKS